MAIQYYFISGVTQIDNDFHRSIAQLWVPIVIRQSNITLSTDRELQGIILLDMSTNLLLLQMGRSSD